MHENLHCGKIVATLELNQCGKDKIQEGCHPTNDENTRAISIAIGMGLVGEQENGTFREIIPLVAEVLTQMIAVGLTEEAWVAQATLPDLLVLWAVVRRLMGI